jgi:hypothetical protein
MSQVYSNSLVPSQTETSRRPQCRRSCQLGDWRNHKDWLKGIKLPHPTGVETSKSLGLVRGIFQILFFKSYAVVLVVLICLSILGGLLRIH